MPVDPRLKAQTDLILHSLEHVAAFPDNWEEVGEVDYLYRENRILTREQDADRVVGALTQILTEQGGGDVPEREEQWFERHRVNAGVFRLELLRQAPLPLPDLLDRLDARLRPGLGTLDHVVFICPHSCPASEPIEVPPGTVDPLPPPGLNARYCGRGHCIAWPGCDGDAVSVSIVDTGLIPAVAAAHPWLAGVQGVEENPYSGDHNIVPYAGHGTFVAGVARCMAPNASVFVERAFDIAGADYETRLAPSLEDALDRDPDILVFTFTASTRNDRSLLIFEDFYERRIRDLKGLVVLAPAGNDGRQRRMWPAASHEVISVGALAANGRDRADFSNFGKWVDVFAPGQGLVNAFPEGTYECNEPPIGDRREFHGMAKWSGTSFSTPIVAGLIATRMSATGENAEQAADSLLRLACGQAIPGVGAVLYPGQACCEISHCHEAGTV
jgi:hypothetical protein